MPTKRVRKKDMTIGPITLNVYLHLRWHGRRAITSCVPARPLGGVVAPAPFSERQKKTSSGTSPSAAS